MHACLASSVKTWDSARIKKIDYEISRKQLTVERSTGPVSNLIPSSKTKIYWMVEKRSYLSAYFVIARLYFWIIVPVPVSFCLFRLIVDKFLYDRLNLLSEISPTFSYFYWDNHANIFVYIHRIAVKIQLNVRCPKHRLLKPLFVNLTSIYVGQNVHQQQEKW